MTFSIIIPIYNVEKYLERCLRSCIAQTLPFSDYEIILVNDGTPDNSMEVAERIIKECPECTFTIINQKNQGLSAARNNGRKWAKGEYVWYVDSDDWIAPDSLEKFKAVINTSHPDVIHFRAANVSDNIYKERTKPRDDNGVVLSGSEFLATRYGSPCAPFYVCRRAFLEAHDLNFYVGIFHEDSEYTPRVLYRAESVVAINDVLYFVYQNINSITRTVNYKRPFDLVVVAKNLYNFTQCNIKEERVRKALYNIIAEAINTLLFQTDGMPQDKEKELNTLLRDNKYIFNSFLFSCRLRNMIEWLLFKLSSSYTETYRKMKSLY